MATSVREFNVGLHLEHLEEASFLYAQRRAMLKVSEVLWVDLDGFESRLECHIDALVVGGEPALRQCVKQIQDRDAGVLYVALSVICRHKRSDLLALALEQLNGADPEQVCAVTDALKWELPLDWVVFVERAVARGNTKLTEVLANVSSYRKLPIAHVLLKAFVHKPTPALATALGRLRLAEAATPLEACVARGPPIMQYAALLSLLWIGRTDALQSQYLNAHVEKWPRTLLALAGTPTATAVLADIVQAGRATAECLLSLGLLGDILSMKVLCNCLQFPECARAAATGLNWITGANLYGDAFEAEEVMEDELFDNELVAWRERRQAPMRLDGQLFGKRVVRLSTDPEAWKHWLSQHRAQFDDDLRYRNGQLYSPATLLDNLRNPRSDRLLRRLAGAELVTRYACDVHFEPEMPVREQLRAMETIDHWITQNATRFRPGHWYACGQPL